VGIGVIVKKDERFLIGYRKSKHGENTWSFPGGHHEYGETIEEGASREVMEEVGITIKNIRKVAYTNDFFDTGKHYVTLFVQADYDSGEVKVMEPDKCEKWEWAKWDEFPKPLFLPIVNLKKEGFKPLW
jgi:8-oxo-dGTP diphosphatase